MPEVTLTFDDDINGWTAFHSFIPECMTGLKNKFFSVRNGQLYRHNSQTTSRNTFYGEQSPSRLSLMVNTAPSDIKVMKAISLEGTQGWDTTIRAYQSDQDEFVQSTIAENEYVEKEGKHFAYTRRNELTNTRESKAYYGIGRVDNIVGDDVTFIGESNSLTAGDLIYSGVTNTSIGSIIDINTTTNTLTLSSAIGLNIGDFIFGVKDTRIEGSEMRGYTFQIDLEVTSDDRVELFAVNSEVMKSNP